MSGNKQQGYECPRCKNNYSTAYSMYRHMRKVHNCDVHRCVTLYCPIENCNQSYDRYNALDTHLSHVHYVDIRKETFIFSNLSDFEAWLRDITSSSKTKYIKRSCNNSYRYYRCHRSGLPKTSTDKINSMKSSVKIGRHCPSRIIAKITDRNVQVEFVPTHIGHECEIAKIPLSQKKRLDIACRLATSTTTTTTSSVVGATTPTTTTTVAAVALPNETSQQQLDNQDEQQNTTVNSRIDTQATTSAIIQESPLMVTLSPLKTPDQQQNQHLIQAPLIQQSQQLATTNSNLNLLTTNSPNRQELTEKFEQLVASIRTDKHAFIVKAQLDLCYAIIRD